MVSIVNQIQVMALLVLRTFVHRCMKWEQVKKGALVKAYCCKAACLLTCARESGVVMSINEVLVANARGACWLEILVGTDLDLPTI